MRPSLATLVVGCAVLVLGCALVEPPGLETPRQEADRALREIRESRDPEVRGSAAATLGRLKVPEAVGPLLEAVRDPDPRVRRQAADALKNFEDAAATITPALTGAVAVETDGPTRVGMSWTLKRFKAEPRVWVPPLRASLGDPDPLTRHNAAVGLVGQAPATETFPILFAEAGTPFGKSLSQNPYWTVSRLVEQSNDRRLVPLLVEGLQKGNPAQRALAAHGLGRLKPPAREALVPLTAAVQDPERDVRVEAVYTLTLLGRLPNGGPSVTPALLAALRDPEPGVRKPAASAFRSMEAPPRAAIAALVQTLADSDAEVRAEAAFGLMGFYSPPAREAIPALVAAFTRDPDRQVRVNSARALGHMGPVAREAVPALRAGLRDADDGVRDAAAQALQLIEPRR